MTSMNLVLRPATKSLGGPASAPEVWLDRTSEKTNPVASCLNRLMLFQLLLKPRGAIRHISSGLPRCRRACSGRPLGRFRLLTSGYICRSPQGMILPSVSHVYGLFAESQRPGETGEDDLVRGATAAPEGKVRSLCW